MWGWRHGTIQLHDSIWRIAATAVAVGVAAGVMEYLIHTTIMDFALPPLMLAVLDSSVAAFIAAVAMFFVLVEGRARRRILLEHLRNVAHLNHEVRNALQLIVYSKYLAPQEQAEAVLNGVNRIDRTLKDLFPAVQEPSEREVRGSDARQNRTA